MTQKKDTGKETCWHCRKRKSRKELSFMTQPFCKECFLNVIEKRIRKFIRINKLFSVHQKIGVLDDGSNGAAITRYVLDKLSLKMPIELIYRKRLTSKTLSKVDRFVFPITTEDYVDSFLEHLYLDDVENFFEEEFLSIVLNVTEKECFYFVRYLELKEKPNMQVHELDTFDKPYPETKFATLNSIKELKKILGY